MPQDDANGSAVDLLAEIDALPEDERAEIQARAEELNRQVQALKQLRQQAERSQEEVASALGIKQPSVSKIEAQADMYLSTLRDYIEALGGSLKLVVDLPDHGRIELDHLGDFSNRQRGHVACQADGQVPGQSRMKFAQTSPPTHLATKKHVSKGSKLNNSLSRSPTGSRPKKGSERPLKGKRPNPYR